MQETLFVLGKLKIPIKLIENTIEKLSSNEIINYNKLHFDRAVKLCKKTNFKNINDCIHTAIAEEFCDELITYNKVDFKKIKKYTDLKITIL